MPSNEIAVQNRHAEWLQQLNDLAVKALVTHKWSEVFKCLYEKMEQFDEQTLEVSASRKPEVLSLALELEQQKRDPRLRELLKELIEAAEPFTEWGSYGESMILTDVVDKATQFINPEGYDW
ncbi:MAG: hypothetical protein F6K16_42820 [Symploca sp. SIO2B6]|nr:hypothetical protein [Symploca sp. SIO2B6]